MFLTKKGTLQPRHQRLRLHIIRPHPQSRKPLCRMFRMSERNFMLAKRFFREVAFGYAEIALIAVGIVAMAFVVHWSYGVVMAVTVGAAGS